MEQPWTGFLREVHFWSEVLREATVTSVYSEINKESALIFPNPAEDHLSVHLAASHEIISVWIIDTKGVTVFDQTLTSVKDRIDLNVGEFPPGVYVLKRIVVSVVSHES